MHIQLPQQDLEAAASVVSNLVDRSAGPLPVLSNLLIEAGDQGVQFRGTDMETLVTVNLNATVVTPGKTTVPADTFNNMVKLLPPTSDVSLEESKGRVLVRCDANKYNLMTIPADDFPEWQTEAGQTRFQIAQKTLRHLLDSTVYALPSKDHRRVLLGVYFELSNNRLRLTSTDGKKLARISVDIPEVEGTGTAAIVVPRKLLDNLIKTLGSEGPVEVELSGRQISFRFRNIQYRGNGIDGKYPDCDAVIPKDFPTEVPLNRDFFLQAVKRAGVVTDEKNKSIILKFENNQCHFSSSAHDLGTFNGDLSLDYSGPTIEIAFNFQFLIETLGRFGSPDVKMFIKSSTAPVVFRTAEEPDRLSLLMPIKLADVRGAGAAEDSEE